MNCQPVQHTVLLALLIGNAVTATEREKARAILAATGVRGGIVVHIGAGDGALTAALAESDSITVHGLEPDAALVEKARELIRARGLYGRVSVERLRGTTLPYADGLINLVVAEARSPVPLDEVIRVLAPDGVAYLEQEGTWKKVVKPRPPGIDEWSHYLHDAGNNAVAHDRVVGPPRSLKWIAGPLWLRSHETPSGFQAQVCAGGRVFYILDEGLIGITVRENLSPVFAVIGAFDRPHSRVAIGHVVGGRDGEVC